MDNFSFTSWATYKSQTQPNEGFNVSTDYYSPSTETEKRNQLQSLHSQIKTFINNTIVSGINAILTRLSTAETNITTLDSHEIESIACSDESLTITKSGKTYSMKVNVSGTGEVTKSYVDTQDSALSTRITTNATNISTNTTNITANTASIGTNTSNIATNTTNIATNTSNITALQNKATIYTGTLSAGSTSITIQISGVSSSSVLSFYTSIYGVNPNTVSVSSGSVTLTFDSQSSAMTVGVKVEGSY